MTQLISNQCTIDSRSIPSIQQKNHLLGSSEMLIFTHKFLDILVLLILKCFCDTCTCRQSYKCTHTPRCTLPYLHNPSVGVPGFGKPVYLPMPHWSPRQWESTPWVQVHTTPSVGLCVLHPILVLRRLGATLHINWWVAMPVGSSKCCYF